MKTKFRVLMFILDRFCHVCFSRPPVMLNMPFVDQIVSMKVKIKPKNHDFFDFMKKVTI